MNTETVIAFIVGVIACGACGLVAYMMGILFGFNLAKRLQQQKDEDDEEEEEDNEANA